MIPAWPSKTKTKIVHDRCRPFIWAALETSFAVPCHTRPVMSHEGFSDFGTRVFIKYLRMKYGSLLQKFYQSDKGNIKCFNVMSFKPGVPRPNHRQSDLDLFIGFTDQQ